MIMSPLFCLADHNRDVKEELTQLSIRHSQCQNNNTGSTTEVTSCQSTYYNALDKVLNREYQLIMNGEYEVEIKNRFRQSQRDWLKFRESNCSWQGTQMLGGTGETIILGSCYNSMLKDRIYEIVDHFYP